MCRSQRSGGSRTWPSASTTWKPWRMRGRLLPAAHYSPARSAVKGTRPRRPDAKNPAPGRRWRPGAGGEGGSVRLRRARWLPGAGVVRAAADAAVLGPLAEDLVAAARGVHHRAGAERAVHELPPRAAARVGRPAGRVLGRRDGLRIAGLADALRGQLRAGRRGDAADIGRLRGPAGVAGAEAAAGRRVDEIAARRARAEVARVEDAVGVQVDAVLDAVAVVVVDGLRHGGPGSDNGHRQCQHRREAT